MCGIIGYIGNKPAMPILIESLKKLEYRGYDSAGITVADDGKLQTYKTAGRISNLESVLPEAITGTIGIGHTRWATHGVPSTDNSHPHLSGDVAVVHNGIIENYLQLREQLEADGYKFLSETDTETIAHLLHSNLYGGVDGNEKTTDLLSALRRTTQQLEGSYAIATICGSEPDVMVAVRKDSPLVVGLGDGEFYASSDVTAFLNHTKDVVFIDDMELVRITPQRIDYFNVDGNPIKKDITTIEWDIESAEKAGYEHFMLKEIHEQATSIQDTFSGKIFEFGGAVELKELNLTREDIRNIHRLEIVACGTSWNAGLLGKYLFERLAGIHTDVSTSSEFRYGDPVMKNDVLTIAITQSGETADTLAAIRSSKSYGCNSIAITNVVGSTITRETNNVIYTRSGPEIGVAATKTFTAQLIILYLLALHFGRANGHIRADNAKDLLVALKRIPGQIQK
ncbi:MAG: glutamine--fructose-6-phosphate transaminase (isomerizing), partial [Methanosarcinaceae archaeon]